MALTKRNLGIQLTPAPHDRILAIDPASRTGVAWGTTASGLQGYEVWELVHDKYPHPGERYRLLLWNLESSTEPKGIVYEDGFHRGKSPSDYHKGYIGVIGAYAASRLIPVKGIAPARLKSWTGSGAATKEDVITFARHIVRASGLPPNPYLTDDEADAIALLDMATRATEFWG